MPVHPLPARRRAAAAAAAILALAQLLIGSAASRPASAADAEPTARMTWSVQPSTAGGPDSRPSFDYRLDPGEKVDDYVAVSNLGTAPLTVAVYAADAVNDAAGGFDLRPRAQTSTDVGAWVALATRQITVAPRSRADIPFTLRVPENATPGDHAGGIVASVVSATSDASGTTVRQERRVGARIYLRVGGEAAPALEVAGLSATYQASGNPLDGGTATVVYTVRNTGNVRLAGSQRIAVRGPLGISLASLAGPDLPELLPGNAVEVTQRLTGVAPAVRVSADVAVTPHAVDGGVELPAVRASAGAWAWSWYLLLPIAGLAAAAGALGRWIRRRVQTAKSKYRSEVEIESRPQEMGAE